MKDAARPKSGVEDLRRERERFIRLHSGTVLEYDRPAYTSIEGVGEAMDPRPGGSRPMRLTARSA